MRQGMFITFEGGEGSGKSSALKRLRDRIEAQGYSVIATREPGGVEIAEQIRRVILDVKNTDMTGVTEVLLYAAARNQHLVERVLPALRAGTHVLCDRFVDSSLVYQGYARGQDVSMVQAINAYATQGITPMLTLWFDVDPEVGLSRIAANAGREVNRLDLESLDFHRKVREGYHQLYLTYPERIVRIDANCSVAEVDEAVLAAVQRFIPLM